MFEKISQFLVPIAGRLNNNRYLQVLRDAFMLAFPLTIFGSIFVVLTNLPFLNKIMNASMLTSFQSHFGIASTATMGIMSVFVVFGIGYYLSKSYQVEAVFGGAIALVSFFLLTPFIVQPETGDAVTGVIPVDRLGAKGMFLGMITAFLSGEIYRRIVQKNLTIKMPHAIQAPLVGLGSGIIPTLIAVFFIQILWFFGLHGQIIINSVMDPIWNTLQVENLSAYTAGKEIPHIISKPFMEIYTVGMGGTGMTLAIVFTILIFMKSRQMKQVSKLGLAPGIFNVNEPIIFGLPIVMNPIIIVPWVLAPMVVTLVTYLAMSAGLVPPPTGVTVPWTVPLFH